VKGETKQLLAIVGGVAVVLLAFVVWSRLAPPPTIEPTRFPTAVLEADDFVTPASGLELATGSGTGDAAGGDFDVPASICRYQTLAYSGEAINPNGEAWAAFYAVDAQATPAAAAMADFSVAPSDDAIWALAPGLYTLAVDSANAEWRFVVTCQ
jgi:hypothetical protein